MLRGDFDKGGFGYFWFPIKNAPIVLVCLISTTRCIVTNTSVLRCSESLASNHNMTAITTTYVHLWENSVHVLSFRAVELASVRPMFCVYSQVATHNWFWFAVFLSPCLPPQANIGLFSTRKQEWKLQRNNAARAHRLSTHSGCAYEPLWKHSRDSLPATPEERYVKIR